MNDKERLESMMGGPYISDNTGQVIACAALVIAQAIGDAAVEVVRALRKDRLWK